MTTSNVNDMSGMMRTPGDPLPALACEAHDLKKILTHLADQIADADRRHTAALTQMQERLGVLGSTASGLKEHLPGEMSGVLTRIEDGMAELSERIAEADAQRRATVQSGVDVTAETAPALRSALAADALDAYARRAQSQRRGAEGVDNFDVVDTVGSPRDQETWDKEAADALARLYESATVEATGVPSLDVPAVAAPPADMPAAPPLALPQPPHDAAAHASAVEAERAWLESRFADVAVRLDQSLAGLRSGGAIDAFEARFSTLEARLHDAMSGTAKSTDLASLGNIETQVEDLAAQLVTVQTHFSRLDTIELELRALAERMSVDALARVLEQKAPKPQDNDALAGAVASRVVQQMPKMDDALKSIAASLSAERIASLVAESRSPAPDAGAIAKIVAEHVTQRMPKPAAPLPDPTLRLDELKATLEAYISEQRHGDEQTTTMLDTMQQAMIRLLDRMDAFEQGRAAADHQPMDDESETYRERHGGGSPAYEQPSHRYEPRLQDSYASAAAQPDYAQHPAPAPMPASIEEPLRVTARNPDPQASSTTLRAGMPRSAVGEEPAGSPAAAPPASREDYIAAARRAARMAADTAPEPQEQTEPEQKKSLFNRSKSKPVESGEKRQLSKLSMALMCLILVGASFIAVKSTILAPAAPPTPSAPAAQQPAQGQNPQRSSADQRIQNLEDADVIIEDDRRRAPDSPTPRRSSMQGGSDGQPGSAPLAATFPAALTKEAPSAAGVGRQPEMPPAAIGPTSLRNAAARGDASAEFEVGARFAEGRGVTQDLQQALSWYQRAAAQGFAPAQYRLGSMYERGIGVKTDLARARVWYQRAAEQGVVKAMHNLAVLSAGRDSAMTDYEAAGKWFRTAAEHGLTDSQFNLAIMHDSGLGMERDAKQAYKWFTLAARSGDDEAARRREALRQKLQPQEAAAIEAEAASWRPKSADQSTNDPRMAGEIWKSRSKQ